MKKALSVFLAVLMVIAILPLTSFAITSGDWEYEVTNGNATITEYYGKSATPEIPSTIDGYTVTGIYNDVFNDKTTLKSVTIPNTVTDIGIAAFAHCTALESITFPNSVKTLGGSAFEDCTALKTVKMGSGLTTVGNFAFKDCTALSSVTFGSNVKTIGEGAFFNCTKLTAVTLPNKLTTIGVYAFYESSALASVTIPASVTTIGKFAFDRTSVKQITFSGNLSQWNSIKMGQDITPSKDESVVYCKGAESITLKAANATGGVTVSWTKVTGAKGYTVRRKASNETSYTTLGNTTALSYTDKTAKTGVTYTYAVRAYSINDDYGKAYGSYTFVNSLRLANPGVTLTNLASGIKVAWGKIAGAKGYTVYRKAAGESSYTKLGTTTDLLYADKNVKAGVSYTYAVRAYNGSTTSWFTAKTVIRLTNPAVKLTNIASGIKVTWGKVAGAKGYTVYRKAAGESSYTKLGSTTDLLYTDKTVKAGVSYTYAVRAYNGSTMSSFSPKTAIRLTNPAYTLAKASGGVKVTITKVTGAKGYYIYRKTGSGSYSRIATTTSLSYVDKTAKAGTTYTYAVRAYNGSVMSSFGAKSIKR